MQDWHVKRLEINRMVRAIMVRHRIDLGKITTHVYPRRIMVRGTLVRLNGAGKPLDAINRRAGEVAAFVCSQSGATPPLPPELRGDI